MSASPIPKTAPFADDEIDSLNRVVGPATPVQRAWLAGFLAGDTATWPVYLFSQLRVPVLLPQLIAVSVIILIVSLSLVVTTEVFRRRAERRLEAPAA